MKVDINGSEISKEGPVDPEPRSVSHPRDSVSPSAPDHYRQQIFDNKYVTTYESCNWSRLHTSAMLCELPEKQLLPTQTSTTCNYIAMTSLSTGTGSSLHRYGRSKCSRCTLQYRYMWHHQYPDRWYRKLWCPYMFDFPHTLPRPYT